MATANDQATKERIKSLICALCLEVFRKPKLLPCSHTFCETCLSGLVADIFFRNFPCPSCRKQIDLPPGGVAAFQNNFYIDPNDLEKARHCLFCTRHPHRELELFCKDCDFPICLMCKLEVHLAHHTNKILESAVPISKEQVALEEKRDAVKQAILNRRDTLKAAADKLAEEALASVDTTTDAILDTLTASWVKTICRPVLRFSVTPDATLQRMRDYMGSVAKMVMAVSAPEVTVVEQFLCRKDPDTDVYLACPLTDDKVWLSYEPYMLRSNNTAELFNTNGNLINTLKYDLSMRLTMVRRKKGLSMYLTCSTGKINTYAKKCDSDMIRFFRLESRQSGQAVLKTDTIVSENPLKTKTTSVFTLHCVAHRAFDVDASEQLFVVLEEAKTPDWQRRVQLYRRPQLDAIATYSPPVAPFQPSDVCFYTLGGQEVLLVADELNDAIHVVNVQDGRLSFARYLSPGCPLLVQPTALNTDMRGRLWIACRGGRILTCTPNEI